MIKLFLVLDNGPMQVFWRNAWYSSTGLFRDPGTSVLGFCYILEGTFSVGLISHSGEQKLVPGAKKFYIPYLNMMDIYMLAKQIYGVSVV